MAVVRTMEMPLYDVVRVVPMRDGFMAAIAPMLMSLLMSIAGVRWIAGCRIVPCYGQPVLIDAITIHIMKVAVVQVVLVAIVGNPPVAARGGVGVAVVVVPALVLHGASLSLLLGTASWLWFPQGPCQRLLGGLEAREGTHRGGDPLDRNCIQRAGMRRAGEDGDPCPRVTFSNRPATLVEGAAGEAGIHDEYSRRPLTKSGHELGDGASRLNDESRAS
jgi:hypothetical protein